MFYRSIFSLGVLINVCNACIDVLIYFIHCWIGLISIFSIFQIFVPLCPVLLGYCLWRKLYSIIVFYSISIAIHMSKFNFHAVLCYFMCILWLPSFSSDSMTVWVDFALYLTVLYVKMWFVQRIFLILCAEMWFFNGFSSFCVLEYGLFRFILNLWAEMWFNSVFSHFMCIKYCFNWWRMHCMWWIYE